MRALSYKLQADALGDLDRDTARALDRMAGQGAGAEVMPVPGTRSAQRGTVLVREWQGTLHSVMVMEDGYAWNCVTYRSLSEVARAITGTRWNGPRFFGLRATKEKTGRTQKRAAA